MADAWVNRIIPLPCVGKGSSTNPCDAGGVGHATPAALLAPGLAGRTQNPVYVTLAIGGGSFSNANSGATSVEAQIFH